MDMTIEATYENGLLKPDQPLPFGEKERVVLSIRPKQSRTQQSAGMLKWTGDLKELDTLLGADNHPWAEE